MRLLLLLIIFFIKFTAFGQNESELPYRDLAGSIAPNPINLIAQVGVLESNQTLPNDFQKIRYKDHAKIFYKFPHSDINKTTVFRFNVFNSSPDTITRFFMAGYHFKELNIYRIFNDSIALYPTIPSAQSKYMSTLKIAPYDSLQLAVAIKPIRSTISTARIQMPPATLRGLFMSLYDQTTLSITISYFFSGMLLMMLLYSLFNYFFDLKKEYLYYSLYVFAMINLILGKAYLYSSSSDFALFHEEYLDFIIQMGGHIFYILFIKTYLENEVKYKKLRRLYNTALYVSLIFMVVYSLVFFYCDDFRIVFYTENAAKLFLLIIILLLLIYSANLLKDPVFRFIYWGNFFLLLFSILSFSLLFLPKLTSIAPFPFQSSIFYYQVGLFLELLLFLCGLIYKSRVQLVTQTREKEQLKIENQLAQYEKQIAVLKAQQEERQRISSDMHDELGAGMTAIRLMSEIAKARMRDEAPKEIEKISTAADDVLNKMNAIIWSMNSGNDTLDNLIAYIRSYTTEFCENTNIMCTITIPDHIPFLDVSGDKRRNIFLSVKETLNNIAKHAEASSISITITVTNHLNITIRDNGKGINLQALRRFGNGLKNINRRMKDIGGSYEIYEDKGTVSFLQLPLNS